HGRRGPGWRRGRPRRGGAAAARPARPRHGAARGRARLSQSRPLRSSWMPDEDASSECQVEGGVIMGNRRLIAACWVVRLALAASFLSAVADRLGLWGPPGAAGVSWGSVPKYEEYVAQLNWFLPAGLVPVVGWAATACEVTLAIGLLIGWRLHWVAFAAGILLTTFAVVMAVALGPKSPLDYSVPSAAGAAF